MSELEQVVSAVRSSKKYRTVCAETVRRLAAGELQRTANPKQAIKATKRRLHQVYGAFEAGIDYDDVYRRLEEAYRGGALDGIRNVCRQALAAHSSTRERLPLLDEFYPAIWQVTGTPHSILDAGCGLNPLALPWMELPHLARYVALDIDGARVDFLDRFLALAGLPPLARCQDLLVEPPADEVDVALLLKMSPSLERQQEGATLDLVGQLNAPWVVVSYAVRSLGGREKGMVEHYGQQFRQWAAERSWPVHELAFGGELVFLVDRRHLFGEP
ncbi:MAG: 16S rRNA methyltransferase [Anaerolineae bacterium]